MSLRINTNVDALTAYNNLNKTQQSQSTSNERLSSGLRINKAADDAAGLAISQGLTKQINGLGQAIRNAQDGINMVQTADGALTETHSILQRMNTLAVQAANASNDTDSQGAIQKEVDALNDELDRIASSTSFNGVNLLDGSFTGKKFQVGGTSGTADQISVNIVSGGGAGAKAEWANGAATATAGTVTFGYGGNTAEVTLTATSNANTIADTLNADADFQNLFTAAVDSTGGLVVTAKGFNGTGNVSITAGTGSLTAATTPTPGAAGNGGFSSDQLKTDTISVVDITGQGARDALDTIKDAIKSVSTARASLGALQNRFQHTINNLTVTQQNLQASNSSIQDTDMAQEMSNFTRTQVLQSAGISMLAQANQSSQGILKLLG